MLIAQRLQHGGGILQNFSLLGNGIGKAASLFGNAKNAGIILGAKVPIVLVSRADSAESKLASIAAGSVLAQRMELN